jgi:Ca2+-binding EF-hand superfamily protein
MSRAVLAIVAVAVLLPWLPSAGGPPEPSYAASPPQDLRDVQDLVYLGETRPVFLRLHIRIDGKPFRDAWDDVISRLFQFLDRDGNGVLSQDEIDRAPKAALVLQMLRGNYFDPTAMRPRPLSELGVDFVAGKVTRQGLATYYRQSGVEPFLVFLRDRSNHSSGLTDALFRHLDRNKDGKLSKDELQAAARSLRKLDLNDDEIIDRDEILPAAQGDPNRPAPRERTEMLSEESPFFVPSADDPPNRVAYVLLNRYDKEQDQKLSRKAMALDKAVFDQLDRDHDGELSVRELSKYLECPPDIELVIEFGGAAGDHGLVYLHNPNGPLVPTTERADSGAMALRAGKVQLDLSVNGGALASYQSTRQIYMDQFEIADVTKRGYLDKVQIQQNPYLRVLFPAAEAGSDIKLTAKELATYLDLLGQAVASCTVLLITDHGQGLFELLNTYHDGRLRQNDLRSAWSRVAPWDVKGAGFLTRADVPRVFDLLLTQGQPANPAPDPDGMAAAMTAGDRRPAPAARGPLWFRKMDRNGDGVVSLREFLGSREDFKQIDTNGDGIISLEEAERADALMRKRQEKPASSPPSP